VEGKDRAHHAHKFSKRVLSAINGSCKAVLFDGKVKREFILNSKTKALFYDKYVWCELSEFENNTIVLVLADTVYDEDDYIRNYEDYFKILKENVKI